MNSTPRLHSLVAAVVLLLSTLPAMAGPPSKFIVPSHAVPERYIVVLNETATAKGRSARVTQFAGVAEGLGARVARRYERALSAFSITATERVARLIAERPEVAYVEQVGVDTVSSTQLNPPSWGLDRIDERDYPLDNAYQYTSNGTGVSVFVIDTGIWFAHNDFAHQTPRGVDIQDLFIAPGQPLGNDRRFWPDYETWSDDCKVGTGPYGPTLVGHGTHVASIIAGQQYGVAKNAKLYSVKVINCARQEINTESILGAMDYVVGTAVKPAVVNMSLNGENCVESQAKRDAIRGVLNAGISFVWSAGNCEDITGAGVGTTIVVGAAMQFDRRLPGTAWGGDLFAPGWEIPTASVTSPTGSYLFGYTSAAAPHVAGAAARYLQTHPTASTGTVKYFLIGQASPKVTNMPWGGFPNLLLYVDPGI